MRVILVRFDEKDDILIRKYVKLHGIDLSTFIRRAAIEKIEDECDLTLFNNLWEEKK